jgi:hypothetical protein
MKKPRRGASNSGPRALRRAAVAAPTPRERAIDLARRFKLPEAIEVLRAALVAVERAPAPAPTDIASILVDLAQFRAATGDLSAATADALRAVSLLRAVAPAPAGALGFALFTLARLEFAAASDGATGTLRDAVQLLTAAHGVDHPITQQALQIARQTGALDPSGG